MNNTNGATDINAVAPFGHKKRGRPAHSEEKQSAAEANKGSNRQGEENKKGRKNTQRFDMSEKISLDNFLKVCFPLKRNDVNGKIIMTGVYFSGHVFIPSVGADVYNWNVGKVEIDQSDNTIKVWSINPDDEAVEGVRMRKAIEDYKYSHNLQSHEVSEKDVRVESLNPDFVIKDFLI